MPATVLKQRLHKRARTQGSELSVRVFRGLGPLTSQHWEWLFQGHPDSYDLVRLTFAVGMKGFTFYNLIVFHNDRPVLALPLIDTEFPLSLVLDGFVGKLAAATGRWLRPFVRPRLLLVGVMEAEFGTVGIAPDLDEETRQAAWSKALARLESVALSMRSDLVGFWDVTQAVACRLPSDRLREFKVLDSEPIFELSVPFSSVDAYLDSLADRDMARYLKRSMARTQLKIVRTRQPGVWIDSIYQMYLSQAGQSEGSFGMQSKTYFENVCALVPEAEFVLFFDDTTLVGFELLFKNSKRLISKYVGMDPVLGRKHKLYFISWLEDVRFCIEHRIPLIMFGTSAESLKNKLGAIAIPNSVVVKHRNPLLNWIFTRVRSSFSYDSGMSLPAVTLSD